MFLETWIYTVLSVVSILLCGSESWNMFAEDLEKLEVTHI